STWLIRAGGVAGVLGLVLGPFVLRLLASRQGGIGELAATVINADFDANHEANGTNLVHLLLVLAAVVIAVVRWRTAAPAQWLYLSAWLLGVLAFAAVLRLGNGMIRYPLPALALAAPLVGLAWPERWAGGPQKAVILLLGLTALPALLFNQDRQL